MRSNRFRSISTFGVLALAGATALTLHGHAYMSAGPTPVTINLTMAGLAGKACENGTLGTAAGQCNTWNIGRYIKASENMLLRARAEMENRPPLGSAAGNVAKFYLSGSSLGLGVGSIADVGNPGSNAISGGGPHGSEVIHCIFYGDPLIIDPKVAAVSETSIRVRDFTPTNADLSITLHTIDGQLRVFSPSVVEPLLTLAGTKTYDLNFASLPGAATMPAMSSFDVRSGWYDTVQHKLTGGHFWLTRVTFTPVTITTSVEAEASYD